MSDSPYIFDTLDRYLELGKEILSPSVYLGVGYQPCRIDHAAYAPVAEDAGVLTAEDTDALVRSCTTEEQRATLEAEGAVDFIADSPFGKNHIYLYKTD